jgi:terminase large subunit-like protein
MRFEGYFPKSEVANVNQELIKLDGYLEDDVAKATLAQFLKHNINFAVELLTGHTLFPFQEMMLRGMESKDFFLMIGGRAISKSWTTAMFCWFHALFNPGANIGIVSASFRQSRNLFEYIEKFAFSKNGELLSECITGEPSHKNDAWTLQIGSSKITALPLGVGDKLRGFRFNVMVVDELLLVPEPIINNVILPFLAANSDPITQAKIYEEETLLIRSGQLKEESRTQFSNNKFIGLSSASYKFEFLYKLYEEYLKNIYNPTPKNDQGEFRPTNGYGVMQFSWEIAPKFLYNEDNISKFKSQMSEVQFNREFNSIFTDDSGGFFSKRKMDLCTVPNGQSPTIEIQGDPKSKYILAIDPSWSKAESGDHFAMCLLKLDEQNKHAYVVHNYAVAGGQFQDHANYLTYLLTNFNIVYVIIDHAGSWFIDDINSSTIFQHNKLELRTFEADFDNPIYIDGLRNSKRSFNPEMRKICHVQYFDVEWITKANERLSASFDHRSIRFASHPIGGDFDKMVKMDIPIDHLIYDIESKSLKESAKKVDFIEHQGEMIHLVKAETALIEVSASDTGKLRFTLPSNIKRDNSPTRARRDSYTALLLGSWAVKCWFDMADEQVQKNVVIPFFIA